MSFNESLHRNLRVDEAQIFYTQISDPPTPLTYNLNVVLTMHFFHRFSDYGRAIHERKPQLIQVFTPTAIIVHQR